jgi:hypothetical protein
LALLAFQKPSQPELMIESKALLFLSFCITRNPSPCERLAIPDIAAVDVPEIRINSLIINVVIFSPNDFF